MKKSFIKKSFFSSFILILVFTLASCSNWFESSVDEMEAKIEEEITRQEEKQAKAAATSEEVKKIDFYGNMFFTGAMPEIVADEIQQAAENVNTSSGAGEVNARAALPEIDESQVEYFVRAVDTDDNTINGTFPDNEHPASFSLYLIYGKTYTITCGMKKTGTGGAEFLTATSDSITVTTSNASDPIVLYPQPATGGLGEVDLEMSVPPSITNVTVSCTGTNSTDWKINTVDFTAGSGSTNGSAKLETGSTDAEKIPAGVYNIILNFYKGDEVVFSTMQKINIFAGLKTNLWKDSSSLVATSKAIQDDGTFVLTDNIIKLYISTQLYVNAATGNDSNSGNHHHPLASFGEAIARISEYGDAENPYTIHISGELKPAASATNGFEIPAGLNTKIKSLTICGVTDNDTDIINGDARFSALSIDSSKPVTIQNLTITNGSSTNGGGIYKTGTGSLTIENCKINNNTATSGGGIYSSSNLILSSGEISHNTSNDNGQGMGGAGIYLLNAQLTMNGGKISSNTAVARGGGIMLYTSASFNMNGGEISGNEAGRYGGGVLVDTGSTGFTLNAGKIINNNVTVNSEVNKAGGAGVYAATSFTMNGGEISGNDTHNYNSGGGIYIGAAGSCTIKGGVIKQNKSLLGGGVCLAGGTDSTSTLTLGSSTAASSIQIKNNTQGSSEAAGNLYLPSDKKITVAGVLSASSEVWVTAASNGTFTNGFETTNSGTEPSSIFKSDEDLEIYADSDGEASFTAGSGGGGANAIPLTLEAVSSAATVSFQNKASGPVTYKVNGGSAVEIASGTTGEITLEAAGDKVEFYGDNAAYGVSTASNSSKISCTADCYVYGNIMSLINSSSYGDLTELTQTYTFAYLFVNNSKIKNKTGVDLLLPATTLANYCYYQMFQGCTSLTLAPELPATALTNYCYVNMFKGCTGLTAAPELPATALGAKCYEYMFQECTGLTSAPELPATTLADFCYDGMFNGCTGLTAAPELPATTLKNSCYYNMFKGCTQLTSAPELPATTLATSCYYCMFQGCTNLNSIICLATNIPASSCVNNWLSGVASTGTFTKAPAMTDWPLNSASGIPSGWTVDSYLGNKVPGASLEPGDIVFNDGSAVAYSDTLTLTPEQEAAAIAVIFYKGDGLNKSGDTSIRTLGVGLIQKANIGWAANGAVAIGQDITAIQGDLTSGDKYGKDNLSAISAFLSANESITDDTTTLSNYPVFNFAANYKTEKLGSETSSRLTGTAFENGWYIPTIQELNQAYLIKDTLNAALDLCGGAQMTASYWSSNQNSGYKSNANNLTFSNGNMTANGTGMVNGFHMSTRVIREF